MLRSEVRAIRDSLPTTADGIAELLRKEKIVGSVGEAETCPLANYFLRYLPNSVRNIVVFDAIYVTARLPRKRLKSTKAMREFIDNFDALKYDDLIVRTPESTSEIFTDQIPQ